MSGPNDPPLPARRLARLREELVEEAVPLPIDGPGGPALLAEILHARQPPVHEGRAPRYGALVFPDRTSLPPDAALVDLPGAEGAADRRFADGRGSFLVVEGGRPGPLVCFERSFEHEAGLVALQRETGAVAVQRTATGRVRIATDAGLVEWDGVRWTFKPAASRYEAPVRRLVPGADPAVLSPLLEFCVHWLSAGRVGATLVWYLADAACDAFLRDPTPLAPGPPALHVAHRRHFPALLSALSQLDRAAVIRPDGRLARLGLELVPSRRAEELVPSTGGTRHSSARRFSFDEPAALVFVVSEDGPVSVFSDGAPAATVRTDPCRSGFAPELLDAEPDPGGEQTVRCPGCGGCLLVDTIEFPGWGGGPETLACPVCARPLEFDVYRAAIRGVVKGR